MTAVLLRLPLAQTIGSMADTSLLVIKRLGLSKTHRQDRVLPVVIVSLSTSLHATGSAATRRLRSPTMGD